MTSYLFCCKVHRSFSGEYRIMWPNLGAKKRVKIKPPPRDHRSSSAYQEVPVKVKVQPAPESPLTHRESQSRPKASRDAQKEKRYKSLRMVAAWENKWPTLPQLDFTTVSRHEIDTLDTWEAVYRWSEVARVGALIQNKSFLFFFFFF